MQPLRNWRAGKAWQRRLAEAVSRPRHPYRSGRDAEVLLLAQQDDPAALSAARAFAKTERERGATVHLLCYTAVKPAKDESPSDDLWTPATLGFGGLPAAEREAFWRKRTYDLVVHCSLSAFAPFDYLVAGLSAHRRIAAYDDALDAYDLVVASPPGGGVAEFLTQTRRYLDVLSPDYA